MAITIPDGYLTRPAASKVYNRSKRALERDLEDAYVADDQDVLAAFQLVTNDRDKREARAVTTELVEQLKMDGKNPVWCVSEAWLESKYGRKGESRPEPRQSDEKPDKQETPPPKSSNRSEDLPGDRGETGTTESGEVEHSYLPDDVEFLKERIRTLEREKRQEIERNEKREAKLFEQLAVKDKQISAWDEVTQGITRGLATGAIQPKLIHGTVAGDGPVRRPESSPVSPEGPSSEIIDTATVTPSKTAEVPERQAPAEAKPEALKKKRPKPKVGNMNKAKQSTSKKTSSKKAPAKKAKPSGQSVDKRGLFSRLFR